MKAQRRHELRENDLMHALQSAGRYLEQNGRTVGVAVIVVLAVVAAVGFAMRSRSAAVEDVWRRKAQLSFESPETGKESLAALGHMIDEVSDRGFVLAGLIDQAEQALRLSQETPLPPDRALNDIAREAARELLRRFPDNPLALGVGHSVLATVAENDFVLDADPSHRDEAKKHLEAIINDSRLNGTPFQQVAMDRLKRLNRTFTYVEFEYTMPEAPADPPAEDTADAAVDAPAPGAAIDPIDPIELAEPAQPRTGPTDGSG